MNAIEADLVPRPCPTSRLPGEGVARIIRKASAESVLRFLATTVLAVMVG